MSEDFDLDLDFTGVSREGGTFTLLNEGKQILVVADVEINDAKSGNGKVVHVSYECGDAKLQDWFSLAPKAKFGFRNWLEALTGSEIEGAVSLKKSELIGMEIGAIVTIQDSKDKFNFDVETGEKTPRKYNQIETYFNVS